MTGGDPGRDFRIEHVREADTLTVRMEGELDIAAAPLLEEQLRESSMQGARKLVLDLSGLLFMDSTGLRAILSVQELCRLRSCELALIPGPQNVQRVFELVGLAGKLPFDGVQQRQAAPREPADETPAR